MIWTSCASASRSSCCESGSSGQCRTRSTPGGDRIRQAIEEADKARAEARKLLEEHRALIQSARGDAEQILAEARRSPMRRGIG